MQLTELLVTTLATWQTIEIWHHGRLFASWRARTELWENKLGELLVCTFCLSVWVAWLFCLAFWASGLLEPAYAQLALIPIYGLAAARLANLGNDVFHSLCRTPRMLPEDFKSTFEAEEKS